MQTNTDKTEALFKAYEQYLPNNTPTSKDLDHPLLHNIGQPHKTKMLSLFFAIALNLPENEINELKDDALESLTEGFNAIAEPNDKQKIAIQGVVDQKDKWVKQMRLFLRQAGAIKKEQVPLNQLLSEPSDNNAPTIN